MGYHAELNEWMSEEDKPLEQLLNDEVLNWTSEEESNSDLYFTETDETNNNIK